MQSIMINTKYVQLCSTTTKMILTNNDATLVICHYDQLKPAHNRRQKMFQWVTVTIYAPNTPQ